MRPVYRMAWVGYAEHDDAKTLRPVSSAGGTSILAGHHINLGRHGYWVAAITGTPCATGRAPAIQDITILPASSLARQCFCGGAIGPASRSPLGMNEANAIGVLTIYSTEPNTFTPDEAGN